MIPVLTDRNGEKNEINFGMLVQFDDAKVDFNLIGAKKSATVQLRSCSIFFT